MISLFTLVRQNILLNKELVNTFKEVAESGVFILGPNVSRFEEEFAKYVGVKYAVGVASGTDAISLALLAGGVKHGDEVIMPANSYPSVFAVTQIGAIPKLVDIDPITFNINADKIPQAITKKTKAIMPVHIYGQPADMGKIMEISNEYKIPVIEDCAQSVGAAVRHLGSGRLKRGESHDSPDGGGIWKKVGSIGNAGCFSFYPTKNLGCFGDGGMVVTNDVKIAQKVRLMRMYGEKRRYESVMLGKNSRLDELQAAILLVKLKYLDKWNKRRREIANLYISQFSILNSQFKLPTEAYYANHIYHLFVIRTQKRDELKAYLEKKGIRTAIHYPVPIHLVPSMKFLGYKKGDFPDSEKACEEILSIPMFPELTDGEVIQVTRFISQFLRSQIL